MAETTILVKQVIKRQAGNRDVWDLVDGNDDKYTIWDEPLADQATGLIGQRAHLAYVTRQREHNGRVYNNHNVSAITAAQPDPPPASSSPGRADNPDVRASIHRQTATKVAVDFLSYLPQNKQTYQNLIAVSQALATFYDGDSLPAQDKNAPDPDDSIPF